MKINESMARFGIFNSNPSKKMRKQYNILLEKAMQAQRNADMKTYAKLTEESNKKDENNLPQEMPDFRSLSLNLYQTIIQNKELLDLTPSERNECATILLPIRNESIQDSNKQLNLIIVGLVVSLLLGVVLGQKIKF